MKRSTSITLKNIELKLISELIKNSRRSDRELARAIGTSQPTVTRMRQRLEKEGLIKEYTMIPDFNKLGYKLMGLTFMQLKRQLTREEIEKAREVGRKQAENPPFGIIMSESGMGMKYDGVMITLYKDYSSYMEHVRFTKEFPFLETERIESFLINLESGTHFRPLTLSTLAKHLLASQAEKKA